MKQHHEKNFQWVLLNFPDELSKEQEKILRDLKVRLSRFYIDFKASLQTSFQIVLISAYPVEPEKLILSLQLPDKRPSLGRIRSHFLEKVFEDLWMDGSKIRSVLGIKEIRIEEINNYNKGSFSPEGKTHKEFPSLNLVTHIPLWTFDDVILTENVKGDIRRTLALLENKTKIFRDWGLEKIYPNPKIMISLSGPPGTGKTMTAHAVASYLGLKIMEISYAQIESKYLGEGPKNLRSVFEKSQKENALLFFDEADSLLGKRIRNVTEGSEQAINSMRSQMLIEIDRFQGIAIFATNLTENYDFGFDSRLVHIKFNLPDRNARKELLGLYLVESLPGRNAVDIEKITQLTQGFSGRDLRDVVLFSATEMARRNDYDLNASMLDVLDFIKRNRLSTKL